MKFVIDEKLSCAQSKSAVYLLTKYSYKSNIENAKVQFIKEKSSGDDYRIEVYSDTIKVYGETSVAFNSAVGKILRSNIDEINGFSCHFENEIRGTYFANHFYNCYHKAPIESICEYMETLALWGQSVVQLWFDMHHFSSINDEEARKMIDRMRAIFKKAKELGMKTSLLRVSNEYYNIGQDDNLAQNSTENGLYKSKLNGYYYTELCPSYEIGRKKIKDCMCELISEFSDIGLDILNLWPYDQGGCTCEKCYPWGANGHYQLSKELAKDAKEIFPDIKIIYSAWFFELFTDGEWDAFFDVSAKDEDWFDYVMVNICDPLPDRIKVLNVPVLSFPEISMQGAVPWGGFGANPLPKALGSQFDSSNKYCGGGIVYSEGIFDDINKIISLELFRDSSLIADEILMEYCKFYFGREHANELTELIKMLETTLYRGRYESDGLRNDYPPVGKRKEIPVIRFDNEENIEKIKDAFLALDEKLTDEIKNEWRYKMLYIRANGDYELYKNNGLANEVTDKIYGQLTDIYGVDDSDYVVSPYTQKNILENRGHI